MPEIKLFELGPTRSARARWALLEAELPFESIGNDVSIIGSAELLAVHPLGKLPAMLIGSLLGIQIGAMVTIADQCPVEEVPGRVDPVAEAGTEDGALGDAGDDDLLHFSGGLWFILRRSDRRNGKQDCCQHGVPP